MFRCISRHLQGELHLGETWYRDAIKCVTLVGVTKELSTTWKCTEWNTSIYHDKFRVRSTRSTGFVRYITFTIK